MNQTNTNSKRLLVIGVIAAAAVIVVCALVVWKFASTSTEPPASDAETAPDETVVAFFKSLAALDVEESQLAQEILKDATRSQPGEPALWANLAVAQMRLRDLDGARKSLERALALADDSSELAFLRAEFLAESGEIEPAIEQLRQIHRRQPDVAATYLLATLLGQMGGEQADQQRLSLLSDILTRVPGNLRVRCEQARLAATLEQRQQLQPAIDALWRDKEHWSEAANEQLSQAREAEAAGDFRGAARSLTFFENLVKPHADYQQSLAQVGVSTASAIGTPLRSLQRLKLPAVEAAEADVALEFELQKFPKTAARPNLVLAMEQAGERRSTLLSISGDTLQAGESAALPFPGSTMHVNPASIAAADLNFDFRQDLILAGKDGCHIYLQQEDGSFSAQESELPEFTQPCSSVWTVDADADGDLDLLLSDHESPLRSIRNNGDVTFTAVSNFSGPAIVCQLVAVDLDEDGDVDLATLDTSGSVAVWRNERAGKYIATPRPIAGKHLAIAAGDVDRDGRFDLVALSATGEIRQATWNAAGSWDESPLTFALPADSLVNTKPGQAALVIADVDNNGAVDIIASVAFETAIRLRAAGGEWKVLENAPRLFVTSVTDVDSDGLLDLVGMTESSGQVALNRSQAGYAWHVLRPRANTALGDKRINSFGIGGRIEVRAGNLVQAATIRSPQVHFGLGRHSQADVARIVWPNGTAQAEFDLKSKGSLVAKQRLKGSCPWVFAFDGTEFHFVKDFLWRSPLGLRINAQDTAGVEQTEDWIKISGRQLVETNGRYSLRITAELWETHFFDHVALLVVDHPKDVEVLLDERFVPSASPALETIFATPPQPLRNAADHLGQPLDEKLAAVDGVYADTFRLGEYQGVAEEHWVEFDLPPNVAMDRDVLIVGHGWVYPTDSSINVAVSQGNAPRPFGLTLEQRNSSGGWDVLQGDLGFPAGKNKDVVIALPRESIARSSHFRLRTNVEIYWDSLGWSYKVSNVKPQIDHVPVKVAELRTRGFSKLLPTDRRRPDTPVYEVESTEQRWLDLEGYYTRFGDVQELLAAVDDRYVIMNAGDELVLEFEAGANVPSGWQRDFVLIGDGWVKDGDFNTAFSQWVRPLPAHDQPYYSGPLTPLDRDPVYLRHADDWRVYHTRYVTPQRFQRGLRPARRGLAQLAESSGQNVPVPLSAAKRASGDQD